MQGLFFKNFSRDEVDVDVWEVFRVWVLVAEN